MERTFCIQDQCIFFFSYFKKCPFEFKIADNFVYFQDSYYEVTSISNLGVASKELVVERLGHILLTYANGSVCINADGERTSYTTTIHFGGTLCPSTLCLIIIT